MASAYATTHKLIVRGIDIQARTPRRYVVVAVRPVPFVVPDGTHATPGIYVAFARVLKTTDLVAHAKKASRRYHAPYGAFAVVVDTVTGEEVAA